MEKACERCGAKFTRPPSLMGRFCSKSCWYGSNRKNTTTRRRMLYRPDHALAGNTGLVSAARAILFNRIGAGWHSCHWCGRKIRWRIGKSGNLVDAVIADHVNNDPLDDAPENIVASCGACNGTRTQAIRTGELFVTNPNGTRARAVERQCQTCQSTFLVVPAQLNKPGKGRYCSLSCARKAPRKQRQ